jgi:transposase-like protein
VKQKRYSEAFKMEVVRALEAGRYGSVYEISRAYGIGASRTVRVWLQGYGKETLINRAVHVMKADEEREVKELRERVKKLEKALANAHLDLKLEEAYLEIACESAGITDVEGFKKKHAGGR